MTINKLERVMWRLTKKYPNQAVHPDQLDVCVMYECGTDIRTLVSARQALVKLEWIKVRTDGLIEVTNKHLTG